MRERLKDCAKVILFLGISIAVITLLYINEGKADQQVEIEEQVMEEPEFFSKCPQDGLVDALDYYEIAYPEIVYAQALLETGHFKSDLCVRHNNLFGLYNSKRKRYYKFNHWTESVKAYKDMIQYRYKPPSNYYKFLKKIHYASDPQYIKKLKKLEDEYGKIKQDASPGDNQQAGEGVRSPSESSDCRGQEELCPLRYRQEAAETLG